MCLLLALHRPGELVLAANRDERLSRPWQGPGLLVADPPVFGGTDLTAGGSWLTLNLEAGFAVAVTNARLGAPPGARSRGHLVVDVAMERSLPDAVALLAELDLGRYGPFNLLVADVQDLWLATNEPGPSLRRVEAPVAVLGNDALDAPGQRVLAAQVHADRLLGLEPHDLRGALVEVLADHGGEDPFCRHGEWYGTVCSTLLRLTATGVAAYEFAPGPPCVTGFESLALPAPPTPT
jgi:uncharacterized protein with NRDE domain